MSARPDAGLRSLFHKNLPKPEFQWAAVETGASAAGLPDSHFLYRPGDFTGWVEDKKTDHWSVKFEPHQIQWHRLHCTAVRSFIAVRALGKATTEGKMDGLFLYRSSQIDDLDREGLRLEPLLKILGPVRSWNWAQVRDALVS